MPKLPRQESDLTLTVNPDTIERFRMEDAGIDELYKELFDTDEALALFIRERAIALTPDSLEERAGMYAVALEAVAVTKNQASINSLKRLFESDAAPHPISDGPDQMPFAA